jgi:hypothetical protein
MKSNTIELAWDDDIFETQRSTTAKKKTYPVAFAQDPLALSWASYDIWQRKPGHRWVDLKDLEAHEHDIIIANQTRQYYRNKLTIATLKGSPMTPVQTVMYSIVTNEPIMDDQLGVLYRLPYFYVEDVMHEHVIQNTVSFKPKTPLEKTYIERKGTITPIYEVLVSRKGKDLQEYWFKDEDGHAVCWSMQYTNPLKHTIQKLWEAKQPVNINAFWHLGSIRPNDKHLILKLTNVELLF